MSATRLAAACSATAAVFATAYLVTLGQPVTMAASNGGAAPGGQPPVSLGGASHVCGFEDGVTWVTADGGCKDLLTGLVWSRESLSTGSAWTYNAGVAFVDSATEGGYGDWRLPSLGELQTVTAHGAADHFAAGFGCKWFWSTKKRGNRRYAADICTGDSHPRPIIDAINLVAVRDAGTPPAGCDGDGVCDPGEDCETCENCLGRTTGPPSGRYCCGNGILEAAEDLDGDGYAEVCDGNP